MQKPFILLMLHALIFQLNAQDVEAFQRVLWGDGVDQFYHSKVLSSGNIVMVGRTDSHRGGGFQNKDGWVVLLSPKGDTLWSRAYGGESRTDRFWDVEETRSGDLLFAGSSGSFGGSENAYVVHTDSNGNVKTSFNYGDMGFDSVHDLELLEDGGWIMLGQSQENAENEEASFHLLIIRTDSCGEPLWMQKMVSQGESYGINALPTENGKIYVSVRLKLLDRFYTSLHAYDLAGDLLFAKSYQGESAFGEYPLCMIRKADDRLLMAGFAIDSSYHGFLMEMDTLGAVKCAYSYQAEAGLEFFSMGLKADKTLWLAGYTAQDSAKNSGSLLQLDSNYDIIGARSFYPHNGNVYFSSIGFLPNEQLLLVGSHTDWIGEGHGGYFVISEQTHIPSYYERELSVSRQTYRMQSYPIKFKKSPITGFDFVQSLVLPVPMHELTIGDK